MPQYKIDIYETLIHTVELEADNDDSALELATDMVENGDPANYHTESNGCYHTEIDEVN